MDALNLVQPDYPAQKSSRIRPDTVEATPIELTVVLPTYNEVENVFVLIDRVSRVLRGIGWEMVFVDDDSPDGTSAVARAVARVDRRVRLITRVGRRGLASACIEGFVRVRPVSSP